MTNVVLTIAGSDSGGGAGIQADLKTFSAFKVYGTSAITCVTAQNPGSVTGIEPVSVELIQKQIDQILEFFNVKAIKTGMLYSTEIINTVIHSLDNIKIPLIIDPVMVATSGKKLLQDDAIEILKSDLLPKAMLVTPNLDEMTILLDGYGIHDMESMKKAVYLFYEIYSVPVLLKGGHLQNSTEAIDILFDGRNMSEFRNEFISGVNTHGTGCTYSAAITACVADGLDLTSAVTNAKVFIQKSIANATLLGEKKFLNLT